MRQVDLYLSTNYIYIIKYSEISFGEHVKRKLSENLSGEKKRKKENS